MNFREEKIHNFLHNINTLESKKWIDTILIELSENTKHLTLYFPHKFTFQLFYDNLKKYFEAYISSEYPETQKINYRIKLNNKSKNNSFELYKYDSRYQLDNFLYNDKQKLPFITCQKIINDEIDEFKQFIIFGEPGSGKTHLIKSILNNFLIKNNNYKILYTNPQSLNSYITQSKQNISDAYEIICIDDFHLLTQYNQVGQYISHHLLHYWTENKKKIFIACNKNREIYQYLDHKLLSLIESGIHIYLNYPDIDVKIRYIDRFCRQRDLLLTDEQIMHLAQQFDSLKNIQRVLFRIQATHEPRTSHQCTDFLLQREVRNVAASGLTTPSIISELSHYFQIPGNEILSGSKRRTVVRARQMGMTLCRQMLRLSYPRIGEAFGGRDHSTVMYSINKFLELLEKDKNLQAVFQSVKQRCEQLRS